MRCDANLVAFRVSEVRAIVVRVVLGPQARLALAKSAVLHCRPVCRAHRSSALRGERDHLPIAGDVRLAVERSADHEVGPRVTFAVPPGPGFGCFMEAKLEPQLAEDGAVEREGTFEVR